MGHKQDGAGKSIPWCKHTKNAYGGPTSRHILNRAIRRRINQALKKSPEDFRDSLRHK